MHENDFLNYYQIEECMCKIFATTECFKSPTNQPFTTNSCFTFFKVLYDESKDYIGYTDEDYQKMFLNFVQIEDDDLQASKLKTNNSTLKYHASVLSYFLHIYINKNDGDLSSYVEKKRHDF